MPAARIQPQGRARVDPKLGIKFLVNPAFGTTDQISGLVVTGGSGTVGMSSGPKGKGRDYSNAADYYATNGALRSTTAYSVLVYADLSNLGGFAGFFARTSDNGTGSGLMVLQRDGSNNTYRLLENNGDYGSTLGGSPLLLNVGAGPVASVVVWNGTVGKLFVGGKLVATNSVSTAPAYNAGQGTIKIMSSRDVPGGTGKVYLTAYAPDVAWNDAKAIELSANPWAAYQAQAPMLYAASAPATVSGGITWTEASDSVAAAGTATVSGTAAWTEASDSAALAGSVGSAVSIAASWTEASDTIAIASTAQVNAAGAWTETSDTTAIAASASITAAAAWTEQADTISMAGSAGSGIAANITWTEAADVTTAAGSIRINAAGSWTEAGDSAAIVVNVAAAQSATLSWTEAPDSIAIAASITAAPVVGTIAWTEQADIAAKPTYPGFYSFTLMRSDPISSAGAMSSSAPAFTLMRADSIASSSKMSAAPINQNVNLI